MSIRGRAVVSSVTLAVLLGLTGSCGGNSKSFTAATQERNAQAAAKAKAKRAAKSAAESRRLASARRAAAQRRALAARRAAIGAALRKRAAERAAASTTTTTTVAPATGPPSGTPTTTGPAGAPNGQSDLAAIQATLDHLNTAFRAGVAQGIATSETVNYRVVTGVYTEAKCAAFEAARGGGVVRESLTLHPGSVRADPGWIDPVIGVKPVGRVYALVLDDVQTLVPTGEQRNVSFATHATVRADGRALLFMTCG